MPGLAATDPSLCPCPFPRELWLQWGQVPALFVPTLPKPPTRHGPHTLQHIRAVAVSEQQGLGAQPGLPLADDIGVILRPGGRVAMREARRGAG